MIEELRRALALATLVAAHAVAKRVVTAAGARGWYSEVRWNFGAWFIDADDPTGFGEVTLCVEEPDGLLCHYGFEGPSVCGFTVFSVSEPDASGKTYLLRDRLRVDAKCEAEMRAELQRRVDAVEAQTAKWAAALGVDESPPPAARTEES